jgi:hypothetical protein
VIPGMNRHKPHMVQFSGHGTADGILMMGPHDRSSQSRRTGLSRCSSGRARTCAWCSSTSADSEGAHAAAAQFAGRGHRNPRPDARRPGS